jgi:1-acyl-sn-glycerol-3-phosphate acyltransferase
MIKNKLYMIFIYPFKVLADSIGYTSYFLAIVIFLSLGVPLLLLLAFWPGLMRRCMYSTLKVYTFFLTRLWLPLLQVYSIAEISGFDKRSMSNVIFVANHRGRLDALLLLSMLPESGVLIKPKYTRIPIYSAFVKYLDFVRADSGSPATLAASLARCRDLLDSGKNLLVFPEGTRARSGKLQAFKDFCFKVAQDSGRPVVPVIVHSDYPFMARTPQSIFPRYKFRYTIRFLAPCKAGERERPDAFAGRVYGIMADVLRTIDKGTYWDKKETGIE